MKQAGLIVGLAISLALGVGVILWAQQPNFRPLYTHLSSAEAGNVLEELEKLNIAYRLDSATGAILVASNQIHEARIKLATVGLPKSDEVGLDLLDKSSSIGASRMIEDARYNRALAGELSRSIATLDSVDSARVHLAIPKQSVFIRNQQKPSASVLLNLHPGRTLDDTRIAGIVHLVASSIPGLEADQVTVVDQKGHLLTQDGTGDAGRQNTRLKYSQQVEDIYIKRIVDILSPIVGEKGVRAQVSVDMDFTSVEKTSESFQPDPNAIRSEQLEEHKTSENRATGVPGALTNQPPPAGTTSSDSKQAENTPLSTSKSSTRNYELGRMLAHSRNLPGSVRRLSVAVVVDYRSKIDEKGGAQREPLPPEQMEYITQLVKQAVGFDDQRGDTIKVINASFKAEDQIEPLPEPSLWEQPWLWDAIKQLLGAILVIVLIFAVLRPVLKGLAESNKVSDGKLLGQDGGLEQDGSENLLTEQARQLALAERQAQMDIEYKNTYKQMIEQVRTMVEEDPQGIAQIVKSWLDSRSGSL
jgi:flagellar M-ring protein FliF